MIRARYFTHDGHETDASHALDDRGILRSGFVMRTMMRDSNTTRGARFVDGNGNSGLVLHKPGYRIPTNDSRRSIVEDSYAAYEREITHRYKCGDQEKVCPDCGGDGADEDGDTCQTCNGSGTVSARERSTGEGFGSGNEGHRGEDSRSVTRDQAYRDYDQALSSAWQNGRTG
jgi:hypothetical protein